MTYHGLIENEYLTIHAYPGMFFNYSVDFNQSLFYGDDYRLGTGVGI